MYSQNKYGLQNEINLMIPTTSKPHFANFKGNTMCRKIPGISKWRI